MHEVILGGGCFWCTEAVFAALKGVSSVEPGYSGGVTENPTYESICEGATGHAEVIRVTFDPEVVSLDELLTVFFHSHDPTTLNRQGADVGSQYRSVVYYSSEEQESAARGVIARLEREGLWDGKPFVTEVRPASKFYPAEEYHRDYLRRNPTQPYCAFVARPKVEKVRHQFPALVKE